MKEIKEPKSIDDDVEGALAEDTAQSQAVRSLIQVKEKKKDDVGSDIELKTELTEQQTCIHTQIDILNNILGKANLTKLDILNNLIQLKERKLLSLKRKSRGEIVDVARNPDMSLMGMGHPPEQNFTKRFFSSRRQ